MANPSQNGSNKKTYGVTVILALAITGAAIWRTSGLGISGDHTGAALSMPATGQPDPRFREAHVWSAAGIPKAVRFDFPAGSENGALLQGTGHRFVGIGGTNTSLGDPVFAAADGKVMYAGELSEDLGNVVILSHVGPDGRQMRSFYGQLAKADVSVGALIARGTRIGSMGTADGHQPAGLLFSLDEGTSLNPPPTSNPDPRGILGKLRNAAPEALAPSALSRM